VSTVQIGGAGGRKKLNSVVCSSEQFSFQMCLESGDGSRTSCNWRQRVPDSWYRDTECFVLKVDPSDVMPTVVVTAHQHSLLCRALY